MNDLKYGILINNAQKQFGERGFECILAIILALGSLALLLFFPIMGIALAFFSYGFLCVGTKKYLISIASDKLLPIETVFYSFKICIKAFCLKVASMLISVLWAVIFIIPGIICALNYSMASFILAENPELSSLECMAKSKKLVSGNRGEIFVIYLCYFLVTVICLCIFSAIGIAMKYYTNVATWVPVLSMGLAFLFILIVFIVPYFELVLTNAYLELVKAKTPKQKEEKKQTTKSTTVKSSSVTSAKKTAKSSEK